MLQRKPQATKLARSDVPASSGRNRVDDVVKSLAEQEQGQRAVTKRRRLSYAGLVKSLEKEFGVSVGVAPPEKANPYSLNAADTERALRKAGVHTRTGKLASLFK